MQKTFEITDAHREVIGREFVQREQQVTRELLLEYADLMGATHPIYLDAEAARAHGYRDIVAMPTLLVAEASLPLVPPEIPFTGGGLNAGYDCKFYREVYAGDTLTYSTCIADLYEKTGRSGTMNFVVRETKVTNQHCEIVALIRNPFILRW
jgi:acyl dehydratase